jgi:hypothetical protein
VEIDGRLEAADLVVDSEKLEVLVVVGWVSGLVVLMEEVVNLVRARVIDLGWLGVAAYWKKNLD